MASMAQVAHKAERQAVGWEESEALEASKEVDEVEAAKEGGKVVVRMVVLRAGDCAEAVQGQARSAVAQMAKGSQVVVRVEA